jgi:hypothetical protein
LSPPNVRDSLAREARIAERQLLADGASLRFRGGSSGSASQQWCANFRKSRLNSAETVILSTYPLASSKAFGTGFVAMKDDSAPGGVVPVMNTRPIWSADEGRFTCPAWARCVRKSLDRPLEVVPRQKGFVYVRHPRWTCCVQGAISAGFQAPLLTSREKNLESQGDPRAGEEVAFVGFPGTEHLFGMFPVLRAGRITH